MHKSIFSPFSIPHQHFGLSNDLKQLEDTSKLLGPNSKWFKQKFKDRALFSVVRGVFRLISVLFERFKTFLYCRPQCKSQMVLLKELNKQLQVLKCKVVDNVTSAGSPQFVDFKSDAIEKTRIALDYMDSNDYFVRQNRILTNELDAYIPKTNTSDQQLEMLKFKDKGNLAQHYFKVVMPPECQKKSCGPVSQWALKFLWDAEVGSFEDFNEKANSLFDASPDHEKLYLNRLALIAQLELLLEQKRRLLSYEKNASVNTFSAIENYLAEETRVLKKIEVLQDVKNKLKANCSSRGRSIQFDPRLELECNSALFQKVSAEGRKHEIHTGSGHAWKMMGASALGIAVAAACLWYFKSSYPVSQIALPKPENLILPKPAQISYPFCKASDNPLYMTTNGSTLLSKAFVPAKAFFNSTNETINVSAECFGSHPILYNELETSINTLAYKKVAAIVSFFCLGLYLLYPRKVLMNTNTLSRGNSIEIIKGVKAGIEKKIEIEVDAKKLDIFKKFLVNLEQMIIAIEGKNVEKAQSKLPLLEIHYENLKVLLRSQAINIKSNEYEKLYEGIRRDGRAGVSTLEETTLVNNGAIGENYVSEKNQRKLKHHSQNASNLRENTIINNAINTQQTQNPESTIFKKIQIALDEKAKIREIEYNSKISRLEPLTIEINELTKELTTTIRDNSQLKFLDLIIERDIYEDYFYKLKFAIKKSSTTSLVLTSNPSEFSPHKPSRKRKQRK